jgi:hypothetical protein
LRRTFGVKRVTFKGLKCQKSILDMVEGSRSHFGIVSGANLEVKAYLRRPNPRLRDFNELAATSSPRNPQGVRVLILID